MGNDLVLEGFCDCFLELADLVPGGVLSGFFGVDVHVGVHVPWDLPFSELVSCSHLDYIFIDIDFLHIIPLGSQSHHMLVKLLVLFSCHPQRLNHIRGSDLPKSRTLAVMSLFQQIPDINWLYNSI